MDLTSLFVIVASGFAGFVDSIVGGGGLILVPAMFAAFPTTPAATLFGTNKGAAVWGTAFASWQFARRVDMFWATILPACAAALIGSFVGAWAATVFPSGPLRKALPIVMLALLIYTLAKKELGQDQIRRFSPKAEMAIATVIGLTLGVYDGFFGPGTGSFLVFMFVRLLGFDFLHASAHAKLINTMTNASALALFALKGHVWWKLVLMMAVANVAGSYWGTRLALKHGSGFVRQMFIFVVTALILKTGYDAYVR
jgi:uncharacterized protein